jgi:hypothetical protein
MTEDTPSCVAKGVIGAGLRGQVDVVVDAVAQLQRSPSPPAVGRNAKLRRIVQPRRVDAEVNRWRWRRLRSFELHVMRAFGRYRVDYIVLACCCRIPAFSDRDSRRSEDMNRLAANRWELLLQCGFTSATSHVLDFASWDLVVRPAGWRSPRCPITASLLLSSLLLLDQDVYR